MIEGGGWGLEVVATRRTNIFTSLYYNRINYTSELESYIPLQNSSKTFPSHHHPPNKNVPPPSETPPHPALPPTNHPPHRAPLPANLPHRHASRGPRTARRGAVARETDFVFWACGYRFVYSTYLSLFSLSLSLSSPPLPPAPPNPGAC